MRPCSPPPPPPLPLPLHLPPPEAEEAAWAAEGPAFGVVAVLAPPQPLWAPLLTPAGAAAPATEAPPEGGFADAHASVICGVPPSHEGGDEDGGAAASAVLGWGEPAASCSGSGSAAEAGGDEASAGGHQRQRSLEAPLLAAAVAII